MCKTGLLISPHRVSHCKHLAKFALAELLNLAGTRRTLQTCDSRASHPMTCATLLSCSSIRPTYRCWIFLFLHQHHLVPFGGFLYSLTDGIYCLSLVFSDCELDLLMLTEKHDPPSFSVASNSQPATS